MSEAPKKAIPRPALPDTVRGSHHPYAAFISYAHRYAPWVTILHRNLERCLAAAGETREVFRDQADLASGRSWVGQLQTGLSYSEHMILVATPESLASPRVEDEYQSFIATRRDWHEGNLHVVRLMDGPLPPFLDQIHYLDFRGHDEDRYRSQLRRLVAGLLERNPRDLPELPGDLEIPPPPRSTLAPELRGKLVEWLASVLPSKMCRRVVVFGLGLERYALENHPSFDCAASAAIVYATGDDDPLLAARRIADVLIEELNEDLPREVEQLRTFREKLVEPPEVKPETEHAGLIDAFLTKVTKDHDKLVPYFQQRAELDLLDRVYVQLELRPEHREPIELADEKLRPGRPLAIRELLALDPEEHKWVTHRWVVLGDPGAGKTTLLRHLAATEARKRSPERVPIFESLPRLMREREWLFDRLARQMTRAGYPAQGLPAVLDRAGQEGRLLLLLDGLDEVPRESRDDAESLLRQLSLRWPRTPLVVTSRPIGYRRPDNDFFELELLPLDAERRREFLARWFGRATGEPDYDRAGDAAASLESDSVLQELASNPLYLTLMALLIEKKTPPDRHRTGLYDQVFRLLLAGEHRPEGKPMDARDTVRRVLRRLGRDLTEDNRDSEPREKLEARLYQPSYEDLCRTLEAVPRWRRSLDPFLEELAERTGILGPHDGPEADWRFWHRTFREALAAEALDESFEAGGDDALLEHARSIQGNEGQWAEPYALLAGRVDDADTLVKTLVAANRDLGLRALATAQGLRDETIDEILELSDDPRERAKVYERIPELVNDPERTLALLDQLRRSTRDGNDLFFLDRAVASADDRWPEVQARAEDLWSHLYDHIPTPPEELFRWIETPADGRVELWREIPAGRFRTGSPEDEEGRFDREGPQHEVVVKSPFRLAAVPVTNAQFVAFDPGHQPHRWIGVPESELPHHPVVNVTWYQAVAFCRWLSASFPWTRGARLPTEEEWEYACRAESESRYWSGDSEKDLARVGWYNDNSEGRTHRVGEKLANPWGLYDVHGNVFEWTRSESMGDYSEHRGGREIDPSAVDAADLAGAGGASASGAGRVIRGGSSWLVARWARSALRGRLVPWNRSLNQGFRELLPAAPRSYPTGQPCRPRDPCRRKLPARRRISPARR